ncbi:ZSWIM3 [Mytilus edulis]|uniref:ZSWIM3 n=1 Tax=Mytilus edulis TaxID=6550 RepID=A0A8S3SYT7_MYTED|nr:ZSWIM3 [Mytilus edulis]
MLLPCRHILKLREVNHENLFVEAVSDRWKINTVRTSHRLFDDTGISETQSSVCSIICTPKRVRKMSQSTKYRETQILLQQMASLASEATGGEYQQRLDVIQSITNFWSHGKKCMVLEVLASDSVESTSSSGNEHEQTDVHVNEDIEDINDDINVTDNKENDTDNVHIFENSRKLVSQEEERDRSTRRTPTGFQLLWIACFAYITSTKYEETWKAKRFDPNCHRSSKKEYPKKQLNVYHFIRKVPKKSDSFY